MRVRTEDALRFYREMMKLDHLFYLFLRGRGEEREIDVKKQQ